MTGTTSPTGHEGALPVANRVLVENEIRRADQKLREDWEKHRKAGRPKRPAGPPPRVLLLQAAARWDDKADLDVDGIDVHVVAASTPLAVMEAYAAVADEAHSTPMSALSREGEVGARPWQPPCSVLVVLTPCDNAQLGQTLLARSVGQRVRRVEPFGLVRELYGVQRLDPELQKRSNLWVSDALLRAYSQVQQTGAWPRSSSAVLDLDGAVRRLVTVRFTRSDETPGDSQLDAAGLLEWSADGPAVARFLALDAEERAGLTAWLREKAGPVAGLVLDIVQAGQAEDVVPLGLVASVLGNQELVDDPLTRTTRVRAEERFVGGQETDPAVWRAFGEVTESLLLRWQGARRSEETQRARQRAETLLAELHAPTLVRRSDVLPSAFAHRLETLVERLAALPAEPSAAALGPVEESFTALRAHMAGTSEWGSRLGATMAVRLARWRVGARNQKSDDATVSGTSLAGVAYDYVRVNAWVDRAITGARTEAGSRESDDRRRAVAEAWVRRWREADEASGLATLIADVVSGETPVNDLLRVEQVLTALAKPLAEKAVPPLVVVVKGLSMPRATALAEDIVRERWLEVGRHEDGREGVLAAADRSVPIVLFSGGRAVSPAADTLQLADVEADDEALAFRQTWRGARLFREVDDAVVETIAGADGPVGVVLRIQQESLVGDELTVRQVWGLGEVLGAARVAGRPVLVTSGGVDRSTVEVSAASPFAPLAEIVLPVLTFVPSRSATPPRWFAYEPRHAPAWWDNPVAVDASGTAPAAAAEAEGEGTAELFDPEVVGSVGRHVVDSPVYRTQKAPVRGAPDDAQVAAVLDALLRAGGQLPVEVVARIAEKPQMRMGGYLAQLSRLLNVEGYGVLTTRDEGATVLVNAELLREQFLAGER